MPFVCAVVAMFQMSPSQTALASFMAAVVVALITALASYSAQSRRFERIESDIASHTARFDKFESRVEEIRRSVSGLEHKLERIDERLSGFERRIAAVESDGASFQMQPGRVDRLALDLVVLLARKNVTLGGALIDAFTDRLWSDPVRTVELATFLRRVEEDPLMRQMAELIANMHAQGLDPEDVKRVYEGLKRQLPGSKRIEGEHDSGMEPLS